MPDAVQQPGGEFQASAFGSRTEVWVSAILVNDATVAAAQGFIAPLPSIAARVPKYASLLFLANLLT